MGIYDIPKTELIERAAKELKNVSAVQPPAWAAFAKTGAFKQRQPVRNDWWFVRVAAILRRLSDSEGPIGIEKVRTLYGGKKNKGHSPERFYRGSGSIIRKAFQQLEKAGFAKRIDKGLRKGRIITPQGISFLSKVADQYMKENNIVLPKKPEGELNVIELPKEKPKRVRPPRKKPVAAVPAPTAAQAAGVASLAQAATATPATEAPAPKRKRAPRKKEAAQATAPTTIPQEKTAEPAAQPVEQKTSP
jgi:small subunit ribosomal protein S19e